VSSQVPPAAFDVATHYRQLVGDFYRALIAALSEHAQQGGTAVGAAQVARRVAREFGLIEADRLPLPRLTKAERDALRWQRDGR